MKINEEDIPVRNPAAPLSIQSSENKERKPIKVRKIAYFACLCGTYFVLAWTYEQTGVALLDLQHNSRVSFTYASLYLTMINIAPILGSLFSSVLFGKFNSPLLIFANAIGVIAAVVSVPWCTSFIPMIIAHGAHGVFGGCLDSVVLAETLAVWGENSGPAVQGLVLLYLCGLVLSPLSTTPFLTEYESTAVNLSKRQYPALSNCTNIACLPTNSCIHFTKNSTISHSDFNISDSQSNPSRDLYIPYSVSAALFAVAAFPFLFMLFKKWSISHIPYHIREKKPLSMKFKVTMLAVTGIMVGLDIAMELSYGFFLTAFSVIRMEWTKVNGGLVTSLFYATQIFGQFLGIFLADRFKPLRLMSVFIILLCIANSCFTISGLYKINEAFWVCCVFAGIGKSVFYPSLFTFVEQSLFPVTGKIAAYFNITAYLGAALNSILIGYLMDNYTSMFLFYVLCIESFMNFILVIVCIILVTHFIIDKSPSNPTAEVTHM